MSLTLSISNPKTSSRLFFIYDFFSLLINSLVGFDGESCADGLDDLHQNHQNDDCNIQDEYLIAGNGVVVEFATAQEKDCQKLTTLGEDGFVVSGEVISGPDKSDSRKETTWKAQRVGLGSVHEVTVLPDTSFRTVKSLNGDQTHQGRHVRISVGDWKALHVRLYRYH